MAKIEINDLSRNTTVSRKEMEQVFGGSGGVPMPPVPTFGVGIALQRSGDDVPPGSVAIDDSPPKPGPITHPSH